MDNLNQKIGILGGGQLGKMLLQAGSILDFDIRIMEQDADCPAASLTSKFHKGKITDYQDVVAFGEDCDIVTIEIENVNNQALAQLESSGKKVYPSSFSLGIIKDKGNQKTFYQTNNLPTSKFKLFGEASEIVEALRNEELSLPFVQKSRTEGYDGKGVQVINTMDDLHKLFDTPSVVEDLVDIDKEIAVIIARRPSGQIVAFPPVEMHFHKEANLVDYLFSPSSLTQAQEEEATKLAKTIGEKLEIIGLLAVELFLTKSGEILINEVAPRPHNSGHHSIEACNISQYEMHLRALCDLPLLSPKLTKSAVMLNILGSPGYSGPVIYEGLEECLATDGVHVHIYGKKETKPFRKLGHVTIAADTVQEAIDKAQFVKSTLKAIS